MLEQRQTADTLVDPADEARRVNLLNWDGKGAPRGPVPARDSAAADAGRRRRRQPMSRQREPAVSGSADRGQRRRRQAASLLLGYPDEELLGRLPLLRAAVARAAADGRPGRWAASSTTCEATPPAELRPHYVETFDLRRRCCLYLTYYTYGDTRKRGMALLRFKHAVPRGRARLSPTASCPTTSPSVLRVRRDRRRRRAGWRLLREHRAGLELLRLALDGGGLAVRGTSLEAVRATLPPARRRATARRRCGWPRRARPPRRSAWNRTASRAPPEHATCARSRR